MKLEYPTNEFISKMLDEYSKKGEDNLNKKLIILFEHFADDKDKNDVLIKVASINKLYSTAITNINPVVAQINNIAAQLPKPQGIEDYINWVDKISRTSWVNENHQSFERNNLSFASKYVHFLSKCETPIFDSYIWIVIKGYLGQELNEKISFSNPQNYKEFYNTFSSFKKIFKLEEYTNYQIDKFLWIYGKSMIQDIQEKHLLDLEKAKTELKRRIKHSPLA